MQIYECKIELLPELLTAGQSNEQLIDVLKDYQGKGIANIYLLTERLQASLDEVDDLLYVTTPEERVKFYTDILLAFDYLYGLRHKFVDIHGGNFMFNFEPQLDKNLDLKLKLIDFGVLGPRFLNNDIRDVLDFMKLIDLLEVQPLDQTQLKDKYNNAAEFQKNIIPLLKELAEQFSTGDLDSNMVSGREVALALQRLVKGRLLV